MHLYGTRTEKMQDRKTRRAEASLRVHSPEIIRHKRTRSLNKIGV